MWYILGQILGFVAIVLGILSYQMSTQRKLLLLQLLTGSIFCVHYLLIGAVSGMALNIVGVVRNVCFYRRNITGKNDKILPIIFTVITAIMGIISWEAWYSIFVFAGMVIHAFCMSFSNAQNVRKSILVTSPLVLIYDAFALSIGGIIYESVAVTSALIGIIRYRKTKKSYNENL